MLAAQLRNGILCDGFGRIRLLHLVQLVLDLLLLGLQGLLLLSLGHQLFLLLFLSFLGLHIYAGGVVRDLGIDLHRWSRLLRTLPWRLRDDLDGTRRNLYEARRVAGIRHLDVLSWFPGVGHHKESILVCLFLEDTRPGILAEPRVLGRLLFHLGLFLLEEVHLGASYVFVLLVFALGLTVSLILLPVELLHRLFRLVTKLIGAPYR